VVDPGIAIVVDNIWESSVAQNGNGNECAEKTSTRIEIFAASRLWRRATLFANPPAASHSANRSTGKEA